MLGLQEHPDRAEIIVPHQRRIDDDIQADEMALNGPHDIERDLKPRFLASIIMLEQQHVLHRRLRRLR